MNVCVVVPMYNEESIARESIQTMLHFTGTLPPVVTLVVVNDGSTDNTELIIRNATTGLAEKRFTLITHPSNQGYGTALRTGIRYALENAYDYVLFMDSDLTNHPKYLKDFYEKMLEDWDYIKATRYSQGGRVVAVPWNHRLISFVGNAIARKLYRLPITDITNGFRAVKTNVMKRMQLRENDFAIIMEELSQAKRLTRSFAEVPYVLTSRQQGHGTTRFLYTPKTCVRYLRYALKSWT